MSGVIRWEDPPPVEPRSRTDGRTPWAVIAEELRERPGEWGVAYEGAHDPTRIQRIKNGYSPWFRPAGTFQACQRTRPDGAVTVYARYVGGGS